jgi:hypothetical protein
MEVTNVPYVRNVGFDLRNIDHQTSNTILRRTEQAFQPTQQQRMRKDDALISRQIFQAQRVVFEVVSTVEDAHVVGISTRGDPMSAKRISVGAGPSKWLGRDLPTLTDALAESSG